MTNETPKIKNPKRVAAGKKIAEARKIRNLEKNKLKRGITKDDNDEQVDERHAEQVDMNESKTIYNYNNIYKNYIPLCLIGVVGIGLYISKVNSSDHKTTQRQQSFATPSASLEVIGSW